jgi:threonine dehydratase
MNTDTAFDPVTIETIRAAAARLEGHTRHTPLLSSPFLDELAGRRLLVKPECLQHTGSFKFRGAWSALSALDVATRSKGVLAYSSGNHAQGVALAASLHGVAAVIIMPADAPALKIANTRALGAEVVLYDRASENREEIGARLQAGRDLHLVKPYDDPQVIAGQASCGLEIAAEARAMGIEEAEVLICCGGGGLTGGIALALEVEAPGLTARPVEPQGFDDVTRSLRSGTREVNAAISGNICDAILTPSPGEMTFPIMQRLCGPGITVSEEECLRAMALAFTHLKLVVEPGGAAALAAALFHGSTLQSDTVIATLSGGNVDAAMFHRALTYA